MAEKSRTLNTVISAADTFLSSIRRNAPLREIEREFKAFRAQYKNLARSRAAQKRRASIAKKTFKPDTNPRRVCWREFANTIAREYELELHSCGAVAWANGWGKPNPVDEYHFRDQIHINEGTQLPRPDGRKYADDVFLCPTCGDFRREDPRGFDESTWRVFDDARISSLNNSSEVYRVFGPGTHYTFRKDFVPFVKSLWDSANSLPYEIKPCHTCNEKGEAELVRMWEHRVSREAPEIFGDYVLAKKAQRYLGARAAVSPVFNSSRASGFVYLINDPAHRLATPQTLVVKIGRTSQRDPNSRLSYYQTAHAGPLETILLIPARDPVFLEATLHKRFKRIRNEWFLLSPREVDLLREEFNAKQN